MQQAECRIVMTLALQPQHWRRHDRAFWAQTLAAAIDEAAPELMRVDAYELRDMMLLVRARAARPPKAMKKLLRSDESFRRLRSRLVDLGADSHVEVGED
ncbi:MAG TPA: hypothetical protein VG841_06835 [Caulobacterales bacterium]|nr:hypothetical protein [Caulobacterales bacterium]